MAGMVPPVADEREALLGYLDQQRYVVRIAAYRLDDEQARATPTPSALSVGGIIKHLSAVERSWMDTVMQRHKSFSSADDYQDNLRVGADDTLQSILDDYSKAASETRQIVDSIPDLGQAVPIPADVPWFPKDHDAWSLRWVLLHLIEETARHAGHADIIREAIDGATGFPLMAAVEGWPSTPWLKAWEPGDVVSVV
ncbi:MAG: DinB family protein [Acidimicrobiales bacterium]